jgi:hypothetical protein
MWGVSKTERFTVHFKMCVVAIGGSTGVYESKDTIAGGQPTAESKFHELIIHLDLLSKFRMHGFVVPSVFME